VWRHEHGATKHEGEGERLLGRGCKCKTVTTIRDVNPYLGKLSHAPPKRHEEIMFNIHLGSEQPKPWHGGLDPSVM
jgi:hypothetical protein